MDKSVYELRTAAAEFLAPKLRILQQETSGCPATMDSFEGWKEMIGKMALAFEIISADDPDNTPEESKEVKEGLALFALHYLCLWD